MIKRLAALMVVLLAVASTSAFACPADKAKAGEQSRFGPDEQASLRPRPSPNTKT
ncbi:MAG: hypothetical protein MZW92_22055 [Comamonadaceae bacterium]|nr:hypothetical protein [Comamonadaceae bacterium]